MTIHPVQVRNDFPIFFKHIDEELFFDDQHTGFLLLPLKI
jgi:hypothetical protein